MALTKLEDLINPQVMADMISAKVEKKIVVAPFAKLDTTLEGRAGDTISVPSFEYIGDAVDVAEGEEITPTKMSVSTKNATIKKAMKAVGLTDEAVLSGYGNPVGEANNQLAKAIASKVDNDALDALNGAQMKYDGTNGIISYENIVNAVDVFNEEVNSEKVIFINPKQVSQLRKDANFISADKYKEGVILTGEIGLIANCRVVPSKKVVAKDAVAKVNGVHTIKLHGAVASGDKITIDGVETTLDATSGASLSACVTALKAKSFEHYNATGSGATLTLTEKDAYVGIGAPVDVASDSEETRFEIATTTKGVVAQVARYECPIIKLNNDAESEEDASAITIYLKRDTNVETERHSLSRTTDVSADRMYCVALSNQSKVVLAKFKQNA